MDNLSRIERTDLLSSLRALDTKETVLMKKTEDKKRNKQKLIGQLWDSLKKEVPEHLRFARKHLVWYRSHYSAREHFLADLYCPQAKLVILLGQAPVFSLNDEIRDARLREAGYRVLRLHMKEEGGAGHWTNRIKEILNQAGFGSTPTQLSLDF